jgi:hypothetical protein
MTKIFDSYSDFLQRRDKVDEEWVSVIGFEGLYEVKGWIRIGYGGNKVTR